MTDAATGQRSRIAQRRWTIAVAAGLATVFVLLVTELPGYTDPSSPTSPTSSSPATDPTATPTPCHSGFPSPPCSSPSASPSATPSSSPATTPQPSPSPSGQPPSPTPSLTRPPQVPTPPSPGATDDTYPQLPFDPVTSPAAADVQALFDTMTQVQTLQNTLVASEETLLTRRQELARADVRLDAARSRRDKLGATIDDVARRLYTDRSTDSPLSAGSVPTRARLLESLGVSHRAEGQLEEYERASREVRRLEALAMLARAAVERSTQDVAAQRRQLVQRQTVATALGERVNRTAAAMTQTGATAGPDGLALPYAGGRLLRPVNGRLSSEFGSRFDPYYRVWQLHAGADFASPAGTPIHAAASGQVVRAGWSGGYGNYTCLEHGVVHSQQRLLTCYAHQSQILVTPGAVVTAGQPIGLVGSTGASTGPHLHFEVRLGGRPVDPLPWL